MKILWMIITCAEFMHNSAKRNRIIQKGWKMNIKVLPVLIPQRINRIA